MNITWLTKEQVLAGGYHYPKTTIPLIPTNHVLRRIKERGVDYHQIPKYVNVTRDNIHSAKTYDGISIQSVVIKMIFDSENYLFLVLNPFDGGLKSAWLRSKKRVEHEIGKPFNNRDCR